MKLLTIIILATFFIPGSLFAQDAGVPDELLQEKPPQQEPQQLQPDLPTLPTIEEKEKNVRPFSSYDEIPQEALDEAQKFYEYCENDPRLPTHYNCQCMGARFLDEYIKLGPGTSPSTVLLSISGECFNIEAAANYAYERCQKYSSSNYDGGMGPEEFCECIGNNYAILLERDENFYMDGNRMNGLYTSAVLRCKTPPPGVPRLMRRLDQ